MNRYEKIVGFKGEARVRYLDGEFQVLSQGDFVRCGATGDPIPVETLRYWNVDRQVPYRSADVAFGEFLKSFR